MQRLHIRALVSVLLLILCIIDPLSATVTATYMPEIPIYLEMSPGIFTHPAMFGAKLGRLEITSDQTMYNPTILITGIDHKYNVVLIGPHRWGTSGPFDMTKEINMNVLAVSYPNGLGGSVYIRAIKDKQPLLGDWSGMQVTTSPFYVDIYLVNSNDRGGTTDPTQAPNLNTSGGEFLLESPYVFKHPPFSPHFTVGITDTIDQGPYVFPEVGEPTGGQFVPIDDQVGQGTTPVVDPGGYTGGGEEGDDDDGFWYGDYTPLPVNFIFSFLANSVTFTLSDAYASGRKEVNTARVEVQNGVTGETYKQNITFTDSGIANSFQLKPSSGYGSPIDFNLYFGSMNSVVPYGQPILWDGLTPGLNNKSIWVGNINEMAVLQNLSGTFTDTITVNITHVD